MKYLYSAAAFSALSLVAEAADISSIYNDLRLAPSAVERVKLLRDTDFVFDFFNPTDGIVKGEGGKTVAATASNFGAIVGNGMAMTIGLLGPCAMNSPHTHPRATEFNFSVNGTLRAGFLLENGAPFVMHDVKPGQGTVFPQGAIHFEMNTGCEPAMFVAGFNSEDPGVQQVAQRFFGLPPSIVGMVLGDIGIEEVAGLESNIPDNIILGQSECLKTCGLEQSKQPTDQRQARVSANALPSGYSGPTPASPSPTASYSGSVYPGSVVQSSLSSASSTTANVTGSGVPGSNDLSLEGAVSDDDSSSESSLINPLSIALMAFAGLLILTNIITLLLLKRKSTTTAGGAKKGWFPATGMGYSDNGKEVKGDLGDYQSVDYRYDAPSRSYNGTPLPSTPLTGDTLRGDEH